MARVNCAVYVRKSTEKGLELEFNSLHNQEDACKSYIMSQAFNNWEYYKTYTDGGISGGTMERPALKQMLEDISKGLIQTVVVYKVDRLSRSIMDFHNMMKELDKFNCNFVSITQAFDTSTSMGKLTLNMLLSFAQFEREVSSERVRDKIHASKAKGLWTGGMPKLGYDIVDKKLVINPKEATAVRRIFEGYLECGSLSELEEMLTGENITHKRWTTADGKERGGRKFTTSMIQRLLHEKVYIGYIENKRSDQAFKGKHEAIISKELWDNVHAKLKDNFNRGDSYNRHNSLLKGKLVDASGLNFINQVTSRNGKVQKRYYAIKGQYLPTEQVDKLTKDTVAEVLNADLNKLTGEQEITLKQINFEKMDFIEQRSFMKTFIKKVIYNDSKMTFFFNVCIDELNAFTDMDYLNQNKDEIMFINDSANNQIILEKEIIITKGLSSNTYNAGKVGLLTINDNNHLIVRAFAYAWKFKKMYESGMDTHEMGKAEKMSIRTIYKYLNLAYLSPRIVNALMSGTKTIGLQKLFEIASKYDDFEEQMNAMI